MAFNEAEESKMERVANRKGGAERWELVGMSELREEMETGKTGLGELRNWYGKVEYRK